MRLWRSSGQVEDVDPQELPDHLDEDTLAWVDLTDPDSETFRRIVARFGLDAHSVEAALGRHERPKVTRHPGYLFLTAYAALLDDAVPAAHSSRLTTSQISAFVLPRAVVTIHAGDRFPVEDVLGRWEDAAEALAHAAPSVRTGILVHGLLDVVVDGHFETIQLLDDAVEELEDLLFDDVPRTRDVQQAIYRLRKELVQLRRVVVPMREVVGALLRHQSAAVGPIRDGLPDATPTPHRADGGALAAGESAPTGHAALIGDYEDLYDHALRAAEWTESIRDMITSAFETNLSLQDARLNTVMKKLASWAAIIAVPTAVTGWFGQNVPYPGFSAPLGLWLSVALVCVGSVGLYAMFKRRDWL